MSHIIDFSKKNYIGIILFFIFLVHIFSRFYDLERNLFGWDQVDNAWAAKNIIVDHKFPLLGIPAKGSGGFFLGPAYYYLVSIFYFFTNLDPIASGLLAGTISIITFFIYYFVVKKLFSEKVALIAVFINTISYYIIESDRIQWNVNFIVPVSLLIFYSLYNVLTGKIKYLLPLGVVLGFSLHVHFTSIFYLIIIILCLPFFPKNMQALKYSFFGILLFLVWLLPNIFAEFSTKKSNVSSIVNYLQTYYHGFHLRRFFQIIGDAFIEFESIFILKIFKLLKFLFLPAFLHFYFSENKSKARFIFCYLAIVWFLVPWFTFSTYSGEISNYYFMINRPIIIIILSYLSLRLFENKIIIAKVGIICFWVYYLVTNTQYFVTEYFINANKEASLKESRKRVQKAIREGKVIEFSEGSADSYLYYVLIRDEKK